MRPFMCIDYGWFNEENNVFKPRVDNVLTDMITFF